MKNFKIFCILYTIIATGFIIVLFAAGITQVHADEYEFEVIEVTNPDFGNDVIYIPTGRKRKTGGWHGTMFGRVGIGYVLDESPLHVYDGEPRHYPAHFEVGSKFDNGWSISVLHRSTWNRGWPIDRKSEYWVNEINISYTVDFWRF